MALKFGFNAPISFLDNFGAEGNFAPGASLPSAKPAPKPPSRRWGEYWNTPVREGELTRTDYLRSAGEALRDRDLGFGSDVDPGPPPIAPTLPAARGGGVGGVGGGVNRRWRP